jgi:uncharacterized protein involved in response to NO
MMLALFTGIFRLMSDNSINTGILSSLYELHPIIMVFGFLASIVMAERVVGISVFPELKDSKFPSYMVPLLAVGVVSEIIGYTESEPFAKYLGSLLLIAGCVVFALVLIRLARKSGIKLPFYYMILSVMPLLGSAALSSFELPAGEPAFIMLLLSFPMIFILGERVELSKFTSARSSRKKLEAAFVASIFAVSSFLVASLVNSYQIQGDITSLGLVFLFATLLAVLSAEISNFKMLAKSIQPLQKYVSIHTRIAYAWAIAGIIFAEIYFLSPFSLDLYDLFIHSLAVGFIGTMLLAHGPVILPSVAGRRLQSGPISIVPLLLLTLANLTRIVGDVILNFYYSYSVEILVGLSGWLVLASVLFFLREILSKTKPRKENTITVKKNLGLQI